MRWVVLAILMLCLTGCKISPVSPELDQKIDNQNGRIEDINSNQNGLMMEFLKLRNQTEINARDIGNLQQGIINQSNQNSGVQVLQGDGPLIMIFAFGTIGMLLIYHYRTRAIKNEKIVEIMSDQIALYDDVHLDNDIFMSAMNTDVEKEVYDSMVASQDRTKTKRGQRISAMNRQPRVSRSAMLRD